MDLYASSTRWAVYHFIFLSCMKIQDIPHFAEQYSPALVLERYVSRRARRWVFFATSVLLLIGGLMVGVDVFIRDILAERLLGITYASLSLISVPWLLSVMSITFFNSFYYRVFGLSKKDQKNQHITYELAQVMWRRRSRDSVYALFASPIGQLIMTRCGITKENYTEFFEKYRTDIPLDESVDVGGDSVITTVDFVRAVYKADTQLVQFLARHEVKEEDFVGASEWVIRQVQNAKRKARWWSREQLGLIQGIGKDWSYGRAYTLEKFAYTYTGIPSTQEVKGALRSPEVSQLEEVLARGREANALLVGKYEEGLDEVIRKLSAKIVSGHVLPELEHKQIFFLEGMEVLARSQHKNEFEDTMNTILAETSRAGNVILAITHFPQFVAGVHEVGGDILEFLSTHLSGRHIQFIVSAEENLFQQTLEHDRRIRDMFERITVQGVDRDGLVRELQSEAGILERKNDVYFTVQAILSIVEASERYFTAKTAVDSGLDLLNDVVAWCVQRSIEVVRPEHVFSLVEEKTGIKAGKVGEEERVQLMQLEEIMHRRIVGQDEAVSAIAHALRRARSGIGNPNRPMGSFLFLGPTGVGKTEVAKTLAQTFFKSDDMLVRFDMSEYASSDALERLIGSFETGTSGVLATAIRSKPYGVLLLDEFEKAHGTVHNLFLQILDEGFFSDMRGERVNARNLIIIATSNEQADQIWQLSEEGKKLSDHYDAIIRGVVEHGTFRPELLNRFDAVILFHPIGKAQKEGIALKLLREIQDRMKKKGITLVINEAVRSAVERAQTDPKFGARAMGRFAQERIEQVIADKIIQGEIQPGAVVELTEKDIQ